MKSHEFARQLRATAEMMLTSEEVEMEVSAYVYCWFYDKYKFLAAARAFGSGEKKWTTDELRFTPKGTCLTISIPRNKVCRKIQEEKWECEPLLSEAEEAVL